MKKLSLFLNILALINIGIWVYTILFHLDSCDYSLIGFSYAAFHIVYLFIRKEGIFS
jgi:hypothetical protein